MVRGRVERTAGVRVAIGVVPFTVVVGFGGVVEPRSAAAAAEDSASACGLERDRDSGGTEREDPGGRTAVGRGGQPQCADECECPGSTGRGRHLPVFEVDHEPGPAEGGRRDGGAGADQVTPGCTAERCSGESEPGQEFQSRDAECVWNARLEAPALHLLGSCAQRRAADRADAVPGEQATGDEVDPAGQFHVVLH